ncbi:MAG: hypothetical protein QOH57_4192 [Mycobacterium sp.]|jgi:uncharacterized protein YndB with AHSA1/START domain|nr:hypothetical protein [Mycobacterium sp.]
MAVENRVVSASRDISAPAARIFALIADPAKQPQWDGNDNLSRAPEGQRVSAVGDVFTMDLTNGGVRDNHVVEFEEGRLIGWMPADQGAPPAGHVWRWELQPVDSDRTRVTHTYDWTALTDEKRFERARNTTAASLSRSIDRLAEIAEI